VERRHLGGGRLDGAFMAVARHGTWRTRPGTRVALLTTAMTVASAGAAASFVAPEPGFTALRGGPWWLAALAVCFALTEGFTLHLRVRRGAHGMTVSEFPMVLGVLAFDPIAVIVVRAVAGGAGLFALRRQRGPKLAFNAALLAVQASVAVLVFHAVAPHALGATAGGLDRRDWLAAYLAMLTSDAVAAVLLTAVIALHDDPGEWRNLPATLRNSWQVAVTTTIALVGYSACIRNSWSVGLVAMVAVVLFLAYRAYAQLGNGNREVEQLYGFTRELEGIRDTDRLLLVALDRMRDLLRAASAEFDVPQSATGPLRRARLDGQGGEIHTELDYGAHPWLEPALAGGPVLEPGRMAAPVSLDGEPAAFIVADSFPDSGPFTAARLRLFQALADHAGTAIGRAILNDRLREEAADKLYVSLHDQLSGLPNRRYFHELLEAALARARAAGTGVAVVLLDLDRFKEINDALGHDTGDLLLCEVGERLRAHLQDRGMVARLGGDEFAVLIPTDGSTGAAVAAAAELAGVVERKIRLGPLTLSARASIGVAAAPVHGDAAQTLIRHADVAMYAAKENRAGLRLYDPATDVNSRERLALIADLRAAVERADLLVAFQAKVDPRTGRVTGAEALCRWQHPTLGNIAPDVFIPLAEHSGLVRPLTLHVLEFALLRRAAWSRSGHDLTIAVNLSPNSLMDVELPETVERLLARTGNPPEALTLEITESTILADPAGSMATLERLQSLGVKLSIDDFGTGYSSLGRLRELPIHEVKIDKSFVQRSSIDHRDRAVVRSAIQLGHALDLKVVAEGVEDKATYDYLAQEGCDVVQGYYLSRPLTPDAFQAWLMAGVPTPAR
jgi:diguanylate cyclase (GGDEF)-like protein